MIGRDEPWVPTAPKGAKLGHVFDDEFDNEGSTTGPERKNTMSYTYAEAYGDLLQELKRELSDRVADIPRLDELHPDPLSASRQYAAGRRDQLNDVITRAEFLQAGIGSGSYADPFEGSREGHRTDDDELLPGHSIGDACDEELTIEKQREEWDR